MQLQLLTDVHLSARPVNVASVPQRSPFRYPGGKTWFVPRLREWLASQPNKPGLLVEPFAGGGVISLTALFENLADRALMIEIDPEIASVWQTLVSGDAEWLAQRILKFEVSKESAVREFGKQTLSIQERAFQTILKNRVLHGGILAPGSGFIKNGEGGKGLFSRWYPATLAKRLRDIDHIRDRLFFEQGDGIATIKKYQLRSDAVFFVDPPYTAGGKKAGSRLYTHFELDHAALFEACAALAGNFIMTYDDSAEVRALAARHGFSVKAIPMKNTHHAAMTELVVGKNLDWMAGK
ncbi:MAG: DNA adenine methylase [Anaerolineae bacterium]